MGELKPAMLESTNVPIMKKAVRVILDMSEDTKIREIARMREKALHDEASYLKDARDEGIALEKERLRSKFKARGMSDLEIAELLE